MDERRICLAEGDALRMLRHARRSDGLELVPADGRALRDAEDGIEPEVLLAALPGAVFDPRARPVQLRFDDAPARSRCSLVRAHSGLRDLPDEGFLEVRDQSGNPLCARGGTVVHVFVESPGLALAGAGAALAVDEAAGRISRNAALVRLVGLAMELCGLYTRDPVSPLGGGAAHDLEPIGCVADAADLLSALPGRRGVARARRALSHANDGSGSAMETLWYALFCLPPRLGGARLRGLWSATRDSLPCALIVAHGRESHSQRMRNTSTARVDPAACGYRGATRRARDKDGVDCAPKARRGRAVEVLLVRTERKNVGCARGCAHPTVFVSRASAAGEKNLRRVEKGP